MTFSCVFVTFPCGVLGQVWYLIVSIPDLCLLTYFERKNWFTNFMIQKIKKRREDDVMLLKLLSNLIAIFKLNMSDFNKWRKKSVRL